MSKRFYGSALLMVILVVSTHAKPWRGIVPLRSTRAEVERLLGPPNGKYGRYDLENEEVDIRYSTGRCINGWNVAEGTVIDISVHPKQTLRLADLKIDFAKYVRVRDPHVTSHVYYANRAEGIRYQIYEGDQNDEKILTVYYESTTEDVKLLYCASPSQTVNEPCTGSRKNP